MAGKGGAMLVRVRGLNGDHRWTDASWTLFAENGDGPNVPTLAAVAATRKLLRDDFQTGARILAGEVTLEEIEAEFSSLSVSTHVEEESMCRGIFERAVGTRLHAIVGEAVARFHDPAGEPVWHGTAETTCGRNLISRTVAWILGLPGSAGNIPVTVSVERVNSHLEKWTRRFGDQAFSSGLALDTNGKLREKFGLVEVELDLHPEGSGLNLPVSRGWFCGVPMPKFLLPVSTAREETDEAGRFRFDVRIDLPFAGQLIHYWGWLEPQGAVARQGDCRNQENDGGEKGLITLHKSG
jgi:hypothetical protein